MTRDPARPGRRDRGTPDDDAAFDAAFEARLRRLFAEQPAPPGATSPPGLPSARPVPGRRPVARPAGRGRRLVPALGMVMAAVLLVGGAVLLHARLAPAPASAPLVQVTESPSRGERSPRPGPTSLAAPTRRPTGTPGASSEPSAPSARTGAVPPPATAPKPSAARRPSGPVVASTPGQVIEGLDITGSITVTATGVVVRDCRVRAGTGFGVRVVSGSLTITDTEITGSTEAGLAGSNWGALRVHLHDTGGDAVEIGSHVLLADSRIGPLTAGAGVRASGGVTDVTLRGNTIDGGSGLAALFLAPDLGPDGAGPVIVQDNVLGGGTYTVYLVDGGNGRYHQRGYQVDRNRFRRGARAGPVDVTEPASSFGSWTGNVWADTGAVVDR